VTGSKGEPGAAAVLAVEVAGVLDAANAEVCDDALPRGDNALLFFFGEG